jgi:hypothetical protein
MKQFAVLKMTHNDNKLKTELEDIYTFYKDYNTVRGGGHVMAQLVEAQPY